MTRADGGATPPAVGDRIRAHWPSGGEQDVLVLRVLGDELLVRNWIIGGGMGPPQYLAVARAEQLPPLPPCGDPEHRHSGPCARWAR